VISYFFPNIEIDKQKYIYNIRCSLWDKSADIQTALHAYKEQFYEYNHPKMISSNEVIQCRNKTPMIISIYDIYSFYCRFFSSKLSQQKLFLVSKSYFEKYLMEKYSEYVCENGTLSNEWLDIV
jgi:hypothetical protein